MLVMLLLGFAVVGELACSVGDEDCCQPVACALCNASAVSSETVPMLHPPSEVVSTCAIHIARPAAPDLSRLTPPPRPLA
jgi:hypothetical protein